MSTSFSQRELRDAFGSFATGVAVITAVRQDGEPIGITANSLTSVSLDPPLLLWCIAGTSSSAGLFEPGMPFAVHVLAHEQRDLAMHFARKNRAKFDVDRHWRANPHPPHIADVLCRFDCRVHARHDGGDHVIVVGEVTGITQQPGAPLTFHAGRFGAIEPERGTVRIDPWGGREGEWM
jgi:3-hydroxy-9,10-secoandrosta-1,3,5(10)-triene-9,17-dione monooxygenase reductase component